MRLITGKVRSGKTAVILNEIKEYVQEGRGRTLMIVPEQYSHEAERELCEACGDRLSLFAEVMSFTGLARWSLNRHGGGAEIRMDDGGKLLCMATALKELKPKLHIYGRAADNPSLMATMLQEVNSMTAADSNADSLRILADEVDAGLGEKLSELALIMDAYKTVLMRSGAAAEDPLTILAEQIRKYGLDDFTRVYIDGFIDFTGLEQRVIKAMISCGTDLTVCLTTDANPNAEYLLPSQLAMQFLKKAAEESNTDIKVSPVEDINESNALRFFSDHMFDYSVTDGPAVGNEIRLMEAPNPRIECEYAAAEILKAVREDGCRWRDIAVAVRGFDDYRGILEGTFRRYGIPLFLAKRDPLNEKSLPLWISTAYDILLGNWDVDDMTAWLRCGFHGLDEEDCDALCSYLHKWQLRSGAWLNQETWSQHPDGYGKPWDETARAKLDRINRARFHISGPLMKLRDNSAKAVTARQQAEALVDFLKQSGITSQLEKHKKTLENAGKQEIAAAYRQQWQLCSAAIRQTATVLGDTELDMQSFQELLISVFAQYDVGLIPVALDRVSAGDFDRMRRRNIRRLIVLGCSDDRLPMDHHRSGLFTPEERDTLAEHSVMIGGGEVELWREYALIYHTLSLPGEQLILSFPQSDLTGEKCVPAIVYNMAQRLFHLKPSDRDVRMVRISAESPAFCLAAASQQLPGSTEAAARAWFMRKAPERLESVIKAANRGRLSLTQKGVEALYGKRIPISPSRMEAFSDCRFGFYCRYGLRAEPTEPAEFHAPEIGTFIHYVLEHTVQDVRVQGGFAAVSDGELRQVTEKWIESFIHEELNDFREKSPRFRHLFNRICNDVYRIVADTAEELRRSDFEPLSFELDISKLRKSSIADDRLRLTGIADRVDGWLRDGRLYLRVVDYKTGHKKFSLSDVCYGRSLQMLVYLYAICDNAMNLYGHEANPAGIVYLPAREELISFAEEPDEAALTSEHIRSKRRSGLVLEDSVTIEAWEHGETGKKIFIPNKTNKSNPMVSVKQLEILRNYVTQQLTDMAEALSQGNIPANPAYISENENACRLCLYHSICHFEEGENGEASRLLPKLSDEEAWKKLEEGKV